MTLVRILSNSHAGRQCCHAAIVATTQAAQRQQSNCAALAVMTPTNILAYRSDGAWTTPVSTGPFNADTLALSADGLFGFPKPDGTVWDPLTYITGTTIRRAA